MFSHVCFLITKIIFSHSSSKKIPLEITYDELLANFVTVQQRHSAYRKTAIQGYRIESTSRWNFPNWCVRVCVVMVVNRWVFYSTVCNGKDNSPFLTHCCRATNHFHSEWQSYCSGCFVISTINILQTWIVSDWLHQCCINIMVEVGLDHWHRLPVRFARRHHQRQSFCPDL